jgi:hypothetical protein
MSLFRGRQDVFAIRWERDGRSGYMPAYDLNWDEFAIHKANGGTLKAFANKSYSPLTEQRLLNHLSGKEVIGLYPLLPDNSSWFIAADFDASDLNVPEADKEAMYGCFLKTVILLLKAGRSCFTFLNQRALFLLSIKTPIMTGCSLTRIHIPGKESAT